MALSMNGVTVSGKTSMSKAPAPGYRYFRVNITAFVGTAIRFQAVKINVGITAYPWAIVGYLGMTSNNTPSPLVASASSVLAPGFEAWRAFVIESGGSNLSRWISELPASPPQWIQLDLGSGNEIIPTSLQLCADDDIPASYVTNFTFLGSNTGTFSGEETILYTSGTLTSANWAAYSFTTFTF